MTHPRLNQQWTEESHMGREQEPKYQRLSPQGNLLRRLWKGNSNNKRFNEGRGEQNAGHNPVDPDG